MRTTAYVSVFAILLLAGCAASSISDAAKHGQVQQIKVLVARGEDINGADLSGLTPLMEAIFVARRDSRQAMETAHALIELGANPDARGMARWTAMHYAVDHSWPEMVEYLVGKGANPNLADDQGWVPLHYAAYKNESRIAGFLIAHGADVNAHTNAGQSPLAIARGRHASDVEQLLKSQGAK